jgi:hypothetical protein
VRRLPGPAGHGLSDGGNSRGSFGLFRDWQRTQTQSSVRTLRSLRQQMDVRFCGEQEPPAERQHCVTENSDQADRALSRARTEDLVLFC